MAAETRPASPTGRLYVVGTPIGNLEDITFRAVRVLGEVAAVACEDTRQTVKILNRFGLKKPLISYYQPREGRRIPEIIGMLKAGRDVALVSDAGTPGISDPGEPPVDVFADGDEILVEVALPGVPADRIELVCAPGELIVRGERRLPRRLASAAIQRLEIPHGHFERRLALPAGTWQLAGQELANGCLQLLLVRRSSGPR